MSEFLERVKPYIVEQSVVEIEGKPVEYSVVKTGFQPALPNFVGPLGDGTWFISDAVPRRFRLPIIAHEVFCFRQKGMGHDGHCLAAVGLETKYVSDEDREEYLTLRRKFFVDLVAFFEKRENSDPVFIREITASRDYLNSLA